MKRIAKHLVLKAFAFLFRDDGPKVVYYHDVGTSYTDMGTPLELLKAHVACARRMGFSFAPKLEDLNAPKKLLMCFDDGFRGLWDERDYFFREGISPTVFIAVDLVGQSGYLTWDEIRELQRHGFVFQSHTWSHQTLAGPMIDESFKEVRTDEWYRHELLDSKNELERRLGHAVSSLCFPCGYFSDDAIRYAEEAGYRYLYASYPGKMPTANALGKNSVIIPRCLMQNSNVADFQCVLKGGLFVLQGHYLRKHVFK